MDNMQCKNKEFKVKPEGILNLLKNVTMNMITFAHNMLIKFKFHKTFELDDKVQVVRDVLNYVI